MGSRGIPWWHLVKCTWWSTWSTFNLKNAEGSLARRGLPRGCLQSDEGHVRRAFPAGRGAREGLAANPVERASNQAGGGQLAGHATDAAHGHADRRPRAVSPPPSLRPAQEGSPHAHRPATGGRRRGQGEEGDRLVAGARGDAA